MSIPTLGQVLSLKKTSKTHIFLIPHNVGPIFDPNPGHHPPKHRSDIDIIVSVVVVNYFRFLAPK